MRFLFAFLFCLIKFNFIKNLFPAHLVKSKVAQGHFFAGVVEKRHNQPDIESSLRINSVGTCFSHAVSQ